MKFEWKYSLSTEAERIINTAHYIQNGFFKANNFHVVPLDKKNYHPSAVIFPDLNYAKIPRFWKKVARAKVNPLPIIADKSLIQEVFELIKDQNYTEPNFQKTQTALEKAKKDLSHAFDQVIPKSKKAFKKVYIYPTLFGTETSFNVPKKFPSDTHLYLRCDQDLYAICEAILSGLTRFKHTQNLSDSWEESESLVDWLLTESTISKVLHKYQPITTWLPTTKAIRLKQNARLVMESEKYLRKLGLHPDKNLFSLNGKVPLLNNQPIKFLTKRERNLLTRLIANKGEVVSYDKIADILFQDEDSYSLYAISKLIQRTRDKLERNGFSGLSIQNQRGSGYLLRK